MSRPNKKHTIITAAEYFMMQDKNQPYQGYVVYPDGEVIFALSEVVVQSTPLDYNINRFTQYAFGTRIKYHETPTPYICETDNIQVNRESLVLKTKATNENYFIRRRVKDELLNSIKESFKVQIQSDAEIDVNNQRGGTQIAFSNLKSKIENETIKREDLYKYEHLKYNCIKEINGYFACFDPKDPHYRQFWNISYMPEGVEAYIPVVGSFRMAEEYFARGFEGRGGWNYCYGVGSFFFGVADGISLGMLTGVGATQSMGFLKTAPIGSFTSKANSYSFFGFYYNELLYNGQKVGFTISRSAGYGAKPRLDYHLLMNASKKSNSISPGRGRKLLHYHRGRGNNLHRHRPWETGWNDTSFFDRF